MDCGNCGGGCGNQDGTLYLTEGEIALLRRFGEIPFWPLCRRDEHPVCPGEEMEPDLLLSLSRKGLIRLDEDLPLSNFDYGPWAAYPHQGSMALTAMGQRALDLLEIRGVEGENP